MSCPLDYAHLLEIDGEMRTNPLLSLTDFMWKGTLTCIHQALCLIKIVMPSTLYCNLINAMITTKVMGHTIIFPVHNDNQQNPSLFPHMSSSYKVDFHSLVNVIWFFFFIKIIYFLIFLKLFLIPRKTQKNNNLK
jgi:hypothetical protein